MYAIVDIFPAQTIRTDSTYLFFQLTLRRAKELLYISKSLHPCNQFFSTVYILYFIRGKHTSPLSLSLSILATHHYHYINLPTVQCIW